MNFFLFKTLRIALYLIIVGFLMLIGITAYVQFKMVPELPSIGHVRDIQMQVPLRVYSRDGKSIAEYGQERRMPLKKEEVPEMMKKAILAIEDARFYEHAGVDPIGILRAVMAVLKTGRVTQGASTITMQLSRNLFLTRKKNIKRKVKEMLLSVQIERILSKDEILTLYLNKIFLGHRAYGVAAAAQVYYGKHIDDLSIAQYAMIAGLPKAPSSNNPITNPQRALIRRNYILKRLHQLGNISEAEYSIAKAKLITAKRHRFAKDFDAPYVAEMVRTYMRTQYPEDAYTNGYKVFTTIDTTLQAAARDAVRGNLRNYDRRHGFRGAIKNLSADTVNALGTAEMQAEQRWDLALKPYAEQSGMVPALVLMVDNKSALVYSRQKAQILLSWAGLKWARRYINDTRRGAIPRQAHDILKVGDIIMIELMPSSPPKKSKVPAEDSIIDTVPRWRLAQIPKVSGALVSLNPDDGSIVALIGGFNYYQSKFNRVTQAKRQPGSNFKPFIYSAALSNGYSPSSLINDAPIVYHSAQGPWIPENYGHKFYGPTRLRIALAKSRNLIAIRLIQDLGVNKTLQYVTRFGFDPKRLPRNLTLSLGTAELTPLEIATGFAVFANGGYRVESYFIDRIENQAGEVLYQANPTVVCRACDMPLESISTAEAVGLPAFLLEPKLKNTDLAAAAEDIKQVKENATLAEKPIEPRQAPRVLTPENAWLMTSMLQSVIKRGTAVRAKSLGRKDLAGKTGTTNDQHDAWFSGFNADYVTTAWVGFDQPRSLGKSGGQRETGSSVALPMWIAYMREALKGKAHHVHPQPAGLITARIDPETALLARPGQDNAIFEYFRKDLVPTKYSVIQQSNYFLDSTGDTVTEFNPDALPDATGSDIPDQLF